MFSEESLRVIEVAVLSDTCEKINEILAGGYRDNVIELLVNATGFSDQLVVPIRDALEYSRDHTEWPHALEALHALLLRLEEAGRPYPAQVRKYFEELLKAEEEWPEIERNEVG